MNLQEARAKIDKTDEEILKLFQERMETVLEVARYKKENNLPVYNGQRERDIINRMQKEAPPGFSQYVKLLYNTLFDVSRAYQEKKLEKASDTSEKIKKALSETANVFPERALVACQGREGAYSQKACERMFKSPSIMYFEGFKGVFDAVKSGMCRYGILPVENSIYGSVTEVYDLMRDYDFWAVKACRIKINHVLAANCKMEEVTQIVSHSQAIGQCREFIKSISANVKSCENTAVAAEMAAKEKGVAAICSKECAAIYGLSVLSENISDSDNNYTRFICISRDSEIYPGADKLSITVTLPHAAGSLYSLLSKLAAAGINLTKIESRPIPGRDFEFSFYLDLEASVYSDELYSVISDIENSSESFKCFGCYSES